MNQPLALVGAVPDTNLEATLTELARYGRPRLGMYSGGWHCCVDMNTNTTGTSFEVKSDFGMAEPATAARQCLERIHGALAALEQTR